MSLLLSCVNITVLKSTEPQLEEIMVKLVIIAVVLLITVSGVSTACGRTEYLAGDECCPMCGPGYSVWRHCTKFTSTICFQCPLSSYTDTPNGLMSCEPCRVCSSSGGLRVKRACSSTSDTLCEPLEGHYCTDPIQDGCRGAVEHTKCSPGQCIKQPGTASTDAVCGECIGDTYSNGSFTSCRSELMGLDVIRAECAERENTATIVVSVVAVVAAICGVLVCVFIFRWTRRKQQSSTTPQTQRVIRLEKGLIDQESGDSGTTEAQGEIHSMMATVT